MVQEEDNADQAAEFVAPSPGSTILIEDEAGPSGLAPGEDQ